VGHRGHRRAVAKRVSGDEQNVAPAPGVIRLVVADDQAVARAGICQILGGEADFRVVAETRSAQETIRLCQEEKPHVAVVDYGLPDLDGPQTTQRLVRQSPRTRVLVVALRPHPECATRALRAGAAGFVRKGLPAHELIDAVRTVAAGGVYVDAALVERILSDRLRLGRAAPEAALSDRELQILTRLAEGWRSKEVAAALGLKPSTIDGHRRRILVKLGLRNAADLTRFALRRGLIHLD
jgi:DNA-binding NarL/FixJ family response regulator